jgi:hypothetical protein
MRQKRTASDQKQQAGGKRWQAEIENSDDPGHLIIARCNIYGLSKEKY